MAETKSDWWRGAVIYQIYPRSFQDSNGDGMGDLKGITGRLDHVASLGVDAIWLSPIFTSPMEDMGYDVSDYRDIDPTFGTLEDFDRLIARAHELGLKVIVDQVYSHSSDRHPWFEESRSSRDNPKADWYVWADADEDGFVPNHWPSVFGGSAWQWDTRRRQYYLHNFLTSQPDLNFHNRAVQDEILDIMEFWLDRGVDGFRLDTVNYYFHDTRLRNNPPLMTAAGRNAVRPYDMQDHVYSKTRPENVPFLRRMRETMDKYDARMMVGEVGESHKANAIMAEYTADGDKLHMAYSFEMLSDQFSAAHFRKCVKAFYDAARDRNGWPCWSFSNHDVIRHVSRWARHSDDPDALARQAAALLLSLEGTICLYQGEELGQTETELAFEELVDPPGITFWPEYKGRDGCRTPMVWQAQAEHGGFSDAKPWLPVKPEQAAHAVDRQDDDPNSVLAYYREMLAYRKSSDALMSGVTSFADLPEPVLGFARGEGADGLLCLFNLSSAPQALTLGQKATPEPVSRNCEMAGEILKLGANGFALIKGLSADSVKAE
ncbi:alpha-glucosidase [Pseudohoeflea suaedae]|uniref:Alpha-glucosidase n=1 Tax=Pseudohoeflea suaedae TaxID=877384 RepID=A0A4V3A6W3_9HYPH|nr:alpha-amylase family glycosyl hydrolase [Pseudohoeflea suaedae]TDH34449.1 alpha-glucosidase [Pseudohoeflea suaedae]